MHRYLKAIGSRVLGTQRESPGYGLAISYCARLANEARATRGCYRFSFSFFFFFIDESLSRCNKIHVYTAWRGCADRTDMASRLSF